MRLEELKTYFELTDEQIAQFQRYMELLRLWNGKMNLTAITEPEEIVEKHFFDSLIPLQQISIQGSAADIGSGAGFPGLVWKIACPDIEMTLIEPTGKRCQFLKEVIQDLDLKKIQVKNLRAEEAVKNDREHYDVVTARAVANLNVLSELCIPLVKVGGVFVALKGMQGKSEATQAEHAVELLGGKAKETFVFTLPGGEQRVNLVYEKIKETPLKYPRNYGQIKKKPLI